MPKNVSLGKPPSLVAVLLQSLALPTSTFPQTSAPRALLEKQTLRATTPLALTLLVTTPCALPTSTFYQTSAPRAPPVKSTRRETMLVVPTPLATQLLFPAQHLQNSKWPVW
jgi:hypothetical protein